MMKVVISSGHGKNVSGAIGILNEVEQARKVVRRTVEFMRCMGVDVIEFHENTTSTQAANVNAIVTYHNSQTRDLDVSVHFNAFSKTDAPRGVEVLYYSEQALAAKVSKAIAAASGLNDRGAKLRKDLGFLARTTKPAILVEVCFVDSTADVELYNANFDAICKAMAQAITNVEYVQHTGYTQAEEISGKADIGTASKILELVKTNALQVGLFPSVKAAQMILESNYLTSELALKANNCFGMKAILSGNDWPCSSWDGFSTYTKSTIENTATAESYSVVADFRKYRSIEESIADHSAYLLGAKKGSALRYDGITQCKCYREQAELIKNGGYATDVKYVDKLCDIISKYSLDKYDYILTEPSQKMTVDNLVADGVAIDHNYWLGVLQGTISANPEYIKAVFDRYHALCKIS